MKHAVNRMNLRSHWVKILLFGLIFSFTSSYGFSQSGTITGAGTVTYNADGSVRITGSKTFVK